jgi:ABC-2 type transport system ATP-binding protein
MNEPILEIRQLSRSFGRTQALVDVSLSVPRGVVFGLVGENGAGKTTLIKHVLGLLKAQFGQVRVFGLDPVADPVGVLGRIGFLSEDRDLPDWMRVGELIGYTQAFFPRWDEAFAAELVRMFELNLEQKVKSLSRGQRAPMGLLLALAHRPDLLVLDEPSSGLDPVVRQDILTAVIRTVAEQGRTVLFSSHLLEEVQRVSDQVALLHAGRLVMCKPLDEILSAHRRVIVHFEQAPPIVPRLPGALSCNGEGREWTCVCNGELEQLKQAVAALGGRVVDESAASLEDVFISRVKG